MRILGRPYFGSVVVLLLALLLAACSLPYRHSSSPPERAPGVADKEVTIAVLGASGMVGGFVVREALAQGYRVRALVRTPQKLEALKEYITIVPGDARDRTAIESLLSGSDVVISALGPVKADGDAANMISTTATGHIIGLMPELGVERYILVSGAAVVMPGDDRNLTGGLMRQMVALGLADTLQDKQAEYQLLAQSSVDWTLVRCPLIEAQPFKHAPLASLKTPTAFYLRAGELARFMIEQIPLDSYSRAGPFLVSE